MLTREQFIELQIEEIDRFFSFTEGEQNSRERFAELAIDTYDALVLAGTKYLAYGFSPSPESGGNFLSGAHRNVPVPPVLRQKWEAWNKEYFQIRARNPRLELRDMMQDISESHTASSWPDGYERHIQAWVDAGDPTAPPPFDDRYGTVTPEFYNRLRELRQLCGGWLYWSDKLRQVIFASEPEWQRVLAEQEAAEAKRQRDREESRARLDRMAKRLAEVMAIARENGEFWDLLKSWELAREAKRPAKPPKSESSRASALTGPMRLVQATPEQQHKSDNPPVDSIFAEFIARIRVPNDALTVRDIVLNLRAAVRRELGLDSLVAWRGGPGIGEARRPD